jgi:hypothetical protein
MNNVIVFINSIDDPNGDRERLERGVCTLLGQRSGEWFVSLIEETAAGRLWTVVVECPDGRRRTWAFGRESQDVAIVCATLDAISATTGCRWDGDRPNRSDRWRTSRRSNGLLAERTGRQRREGGSERDIDERE